MDSLGGGGVGLLWDYECSGVILGIGLYNHFLGKTSKKHLPIVCDKQVFLYCDCLKIQFETVLLKQCAAKLLCRLGTKICGGDVKHRFTARLPLVAHSVSSSRIRHKYRRGKLGI